MTRRERSHEFVRAETGGAELRQVQKLVLVEYSQSDIQDEMR